MRLAAISQVTFNFSKGHWIIRSAESCQRWSKYHIPLPPNLVGGAALWKTRLAPTPLAVGAKCKLTVFKSPRAQVSPIGRVLHLYGCSGSRAIAACVESGRVAVRMEACWSFRAQADRPRPPGEPGNRAVASPRGFSLLVRTVRVVETGPGGAVRRTGCWSGWLGRRACAVATASAMAAGPSCRTRPSIGLSRSRPRCEAGHLSGRMVTSAIRSCWAVRLAAYAGSAAVLVASSMVGAASAAPGDTTLIGGVCPSDAAPDGVSISGDGMVVVAECDIGGGVRLFVRDLASGQLVMASRANGPRGVANNQDAFDPSISADGRYVAFTSDATNLGVDQRRISDNVFVRDLRTNTTTLVSRLTGRRGRPLRQGEEHPSISANGRVVAFDAYGSAVRGHGRFHIDVYVRDLLAHTTTLASRASGVKGARTDDDSSSEWPSISADGRLVVFQSDSTNLVAGDHNHSTDVFVRDLHVHTTTLVSRARGGAYGHGHRRLGDPTDLGRWTIRGLRFRCQQPGQRRPPQRRPLGAQFADA